MSAVSASNVDDVDNSNSLESPDSGSVALDTDSDEISGLSQTESTLENSSSDIAAGSNSNSDIGSSSVSDTGSDSNSDMGSSSSSVLGSSSANAQGSSSSSVLGSSSTNAQGSSSNSAASSVSAKKLTKSATKLKIISSHKMYYRGGTLKVSLIDKNTGKVLRGKKVKLTLNGKTYTLKTNSQGRILKDLYFNKTVSVKVRFAGDSEYAASSVKAKLKHITSKSRFTSSGTSVPYYGYFKVTLKNINTGKRLIGKRIAFRLVNVNNKTYLVRTNSHGLAKLKIKTFKALKVKVIFHGGINYGPVSKIYSVKAYKPKSKFTASNKLVVDSPFKVTLKNAGTGKAMTGAKVTFKLNTTGKSYTRTTNSKGVASININSVNPVKITVSHAGNKYVKKTTKSFNIKPAKADVLISANDKVPLGQSFTLTLKHASTGKVLSGKKVLVTVNGTEYSQSTNSNGAISLKLAEKGNYKVSVSVDANDKYNAALESYDVTVDRFKTKLSLASSSIQTGGTVVAILKDQFGNALGGKKVKFTINGKTYTKTTNSQGKAGFKVNYPLGTYPISLSYEGATGYYGSQLSKDLKVTIYSSAACKAIYKAINKNQYKQLLNVKQKFDADEFEKYLKTGGYTKLNDALKKKAASLTKGLSTTIEKANAISEFVANNIAYSYYANSKKGASGTLSSGCGNCVDQASLVVALCRASGIYARYSHAQNCKFDSGLNTGHVWAQIYDPATQTWYVSDGTSRRNNLGDVNNWNTNSFTKPHNYVLISF